jgi:hypothetical protein
MAEYDRENKTLLCSAIWAGKGFIPGPFSIKCPTLGDAELMVKDGAKMDELLTIAMVERELES